MLRNPHSGSLRIIFGRNNGGGRAMSAAEHQDTHASRFSRAGGMSNTLVMAWLTVRWSTKLVVISKAVEKMYSLVETMRTASQLRFEFGRFAAAGGRCAKWPLSMPIVDVVDY